MRVVVVAILCFLVLSNDHAQADFNDLSLRSAAYAETSATLLSRGQKREAMIEALKGLPEPFTENTPTSFTPAWTAFFRAATALTVKTQYSGELAAVANRDRTRVVFKGMLMGDRPGLSAVTPTVLWDATRNIEIAVLARAVETNDDGRMFPHDIGTSPGSDLVWVAGAATDVVRFFQLQDGAEVGSLRLPPSSSLGTAAPIGFSPDGSLFAAQGRTSIFVWEMGNLGIARELAPPFPTSAGDARLGQVSWTSEGSFVFDFRILSNGQFQPGGLGHIRQDGSANFGAIGDFEIVVLSAQNAPYFVTLSQTRSEYQIRNLQLDNIGRIPMANSPVAFARDDTAIVTIPALAGLWGETVALEPSAIFALDGTPVDLQPQDYIGFSDLVFNASGDVLVPIGLFSGNATHLSAPSPAPSDLYAHAIATLTVEEREALAQHRLRGSGAEMGFPQTDLLRSAQIASEAEAAMLSGNRIEAIMQSLRAFPEEPDQADFDTRAAAHRALFRAYASRPSFFASPPDFMAQLFARVRYAPNANTALLRPFEVEAPDGTLVLLHAVLYDVQTGEERDIDLASIDPRGFTDLHFSPDGGKFAGVSRTDGTVHIFDTATGAVSGRFEASGDTQHVKTVQIGFSPDGRYFASTTGRIFDNLVVIWSVETGRVLYSGNPFENSATLLGWSHDGAILVKDVLPSQEGYSDTERLFVWSPEGEAVIIPLLRVDGRPVEHCQYAAISHRQPYLACSSDSETTIINFETGRVVGTIGRVDSTGTFLRDGAVIGWPSVTTPKEIEVFSAAGEQLEPILQDFVTFDQRAFFKEQGSALIVVDSSGFQGQGVPVGQTLYARALDELSAEDRTNLLRDIANRE